MSMAPGVAIFIGGPFGAGIATLTLATNINKTLEIANRGSLVDAINCAPERVAGPDQLVCYNVGGSTVFGLVGLVDPATAGLTSALVAAGLAYVVVNHFEKEGPNAGTSP